MGNIENKSLPTIEEMAQYKVNDLMEKFSHFKIGLNTCYLSKREAKQVALIAVDEILNDGKMMFCGEGMQGNHYKFWVMVKEYLKAI